MTVEDLRKAVDYRIGERARTERNLENAKNRLSDTQKNLEYHEQAREVIRQAGLKTQEALSFHISSITSLALQAVFGEEAYELEVDFVQRRNKTECDLWFARGGDNVSPMEASGGGAVDVASFALRVASWSMNTPRSRPVIVLDEPMRFLSSDLQPKASEMLKELSKKLGVQFIIITHEELLAEEADRLFHVKKINAKTTVTYE